MTKERISEICSKCKLPIVACKCGKAETARDKREIFQPIASTIPEIKKILEGLSKRKKIGVVVRDFVQLDPFVLTVARLQQMVRKAEAKAGDERFKVAPFEIITVDPLDDFVEIYNSQEGEREEIAREEYMKETIEHNRENLKDYSEGQSLLVTDDSSRFVTGALRITASEARRLNETMRDSENPFTHGLVTLFEILSDDPDAFFEEKNVAFRRDKTKVLKRLEGFKEDEVAWYIVPMDKFRNSEIHKATVGELRKKIFEFPFDDWVDDWQQGVVTFPRIVSVGDDAFDGEEYMREKQRQHTEAFYTAVDNVTGRVNKIDLMVSNLLATLEGRDPQEMVTLTTTKSKMSKRMPVEDARKYLKSIPPSFIITEGALMIS